MFDCRLIQSLASPRDLSLLQEGRSFVSLLSKSLASSVPLNGGWAAGQGCGWCGFTIGCLLSPKKKYKKYQLSFFFCEKICNIRWFGTWGKTGTPRPMTIEGPQKVGRRREIARESSKEQHTPKKQASANHMHAQRLERDSDLGPKQKKQWADVSLTTRAGESRVSFAAAAETSSRCLSETVKGGGRHLPGMRTPHAPLLVSAAPAGGTSR